MKQIYFDNSRITKPAPVIINSALPYLTEEWDAMVDTSAIYETLGAKKEHPLHLTISAADAIQQIFLAVYEEVTLNTGKNHFLIGKNSDAAQFLASHRIEKFGSLCKQIAIDHLGCITKESLTHALNPRTALLSLTLAHGLTGVIQPLEEIVSLCKERGVLLHLDVSQALGKMPLSFEELGADFLTFDGALIHAGEGVAGILIRSGLKWPQSAFSRRNVPYAAALLSAACKECKQAEQFVSLEIARLRTQLEESLPFGKPLFSDAIRLPTISVIAFPGIHQEALLYTLERRGLKASCGGGAMQNLAIFLHEMGFTKEITKSAISFSLARTTTEREVEEAATIITDSVNHLARTNQCNSPAN